MADQQLEAPLCSATWVIVYAELGDGDADGDELPVDEATGVWLAGWVSFLEIVIFRLLLL